MRRSIALLGVLGLLWVMPLSGQTASSTPVRASAAAPLPGPRVSSEFDRYQPAIVQDSLARPVSELALADRTTITISTLGLVLLVVLLVLLLT